jgi:hypothetical protein
MWDWMTWSPGGKKGYDFMRPQDEARVDRRRRDHGAVGGKPRPHPDIYSDGDDAKNASPFSEARTVPGEPPWFLEGHYGTIWQSAFTGVRVIQLLT